MKVRDGDIFSEQNRYEFWLCYGRPAKGRTELALFWVFHNLDKLESRKHLDKQKIRQHERGYK